MAKSLSQRKQDAAKSTAFTVVTTGDLAGFKAGDTLSTARHIAQYFRAMLDLDDDTKGKSERLSDTDIVSTIQGVDVTGLSPEDREVAWLETLAAKLQGEPGDNATSGEGVIGFGPGTVLDTETKRARELGSKANDNVLNAIQLGVDGKRDWNGAPIVLERALVAAYGDEGMQAFPPIGTRRQGLKSDTIPEGMTAEQWQNANSPVEFYKDKETDRKGRFTLQWYLGTEPGRQKAQMVEWLKPMVTENKSPLANTPQEIRELGQVEAQSRLETLQGEINDAVNRIATAVRLYQKRKDVEQNLPKVAVNFVGVYQDAETGEVHGHENAARRRKPIVLKDKRNTDPNFWVDLAPMTLGRFFSLNVAKAAQAGGTAQALRDSAPKKGTPKKKGGQQSAAGSTLELPAVDTATKLADYCSRIGEYFDGAGWTSGLKRAFASEQGGRVASEMVRIRDCLDNAIDHNVEALAKAYDDSQVEASATRAAAPKAAA